MLFAILLAVAALLQDTMDIARAARGDSLAAIAKCREGEGMIDTDPQGASDRLTAVIGMPNLEKIVECVVRVELRASEYSEPYPFLPYKYRGQARMQLAKKAVPDAARKLLTDAIEDFRESAKHKIAWSADLARAAQAELDRIK
jgi:hypothetical protein